MKLKKLLASSVLLSATLFAGGDIVPVEPMIAEVPVAENTWESSASLYMWGSGITGQTASDGKIDVSFSDILDNLDMGFMGTFRTEKGQWGIESDFVYMKIGSSLDDSLVLDKFSLKTWVVTPVVTYQVVDSEKLDLHILAGAKYLYMKPRLTSFRGVVRDPSGSLWDGIVGLKGTYELNEKWFMPFRADVGTGSTDVTWQAFAGIGYKYENFDLIAGYRQLDWNFKDGEPGGEVFNDLTFSGPILGAKFRF